MFYSSQTLKNIYSYCIFVDDIIIYAENEQKLKSVGEWAKSVPKTKSMMIGNEDMKIDIRINRQQTEQVDSFNYLGVASKIAENRRRNKR